MSIDPVSGQHSKGETMIASSRQLTFRDFVLLGSAVALLVVFLWPATSDRQWLEVQTDNGQLQRYSLAIDDPSLQAIRLRLKRWKTPSSSRALRIARWHQEAARFYVQRDHESLKADSENDPAVRQVSFVATQKQLKTNPADSKQADEHLDSFWSKLDRSASDRIVAEQARISKACETAIPPVKLGPVVPSIRPPSAYPIAIFAALTTVLFAKRRQRVRPPIELVCRVDKPIDFSDSRTICLTIPPSWVRIHQPVEVVMWRLFYATAVIGAITCVLIASFR